jgi:hypothetical protein
MVGRPLRSAVFIDTENVTYVPLAATIPQWLAWLEHGQFDPTQRRRKFVLKRAYWNPTFERHREVFEAAGIEGHLLGRYIAGKNTADMHMAVDIIDTLHKRRDIEEFIILSRDTDFVPVILRLRERGKKTASLVNFDSPTLVTNLTGKVDILIREELLRDATRYTPPPQLSLIGRWRAKRAARNAGSQGGPQGGPEPGPQSPASATAPTAAAPHPVKPEPAKQPDAASVTRALALISDLLNPRRGSYPPHRDIVRLLQTLPEYNETEASRYLGFGSYTALLQEFARQDPRIKITQTGDQTVIRHFSAREIEKKARAQALLAQAKKSKPPPASPAKPKVQTAAKPKAAPAKAAAAIPEADLPVVLTPAQSALMDQAVTAVLTYARLQPTAHLSRPDLREAIGTVPGIQLEPNGALLGYRGLRAFMAEAMQRTPDLRLIEATPHLRGGYVYVPRLLAEAPAAAADTTAATPVPALPPVLTVLASIAPAAAAPKRETEGVL